MYILTPDLLRRRFQIRNAKTISTAVDIPVLVDENVEVSFRVGDNIL